MAPKFLRTGGKIAKTPPPGTVPACAVVVGACGHGLATTRALARNGVRVIVLESDMSQPGVRSRHGELYRVQDINGAGLIDALLELHSRATLGTCRPVLMLTNDRMVRVVGQNWPALEEKYELSWSECRERLVPLLDKATIETQCERNGIAYPTTKVIGSESDLAGLDAHFDCPLIVKPARPLASFKTYLPSDLDALRLFVATHRADLPLLVQRWIPGDDSTLHFGALLLERGNVLAHFEGRKLRSRPMGHTTIAEAFPDEEVHACARNFFEGLALSGPVSLEVKRDTNGQLWVIEPTVGRTDFWVGLCIENGFNLPLLEFLYRTQGNFEPPRVANGTIWFNEERDPFGRIWYELSVHRSPKRRAAYLYASREDIRPFIAHSRRTLISLLRRAFAKVRNHLRRARYSIL